MALRIFEQQAMALGRLFTIAANFTDPSAYFLGGVAVETTPELRDWFLARVWRTRCCVSCVKKLARWILPAEEGPMRRSCLNDTRPKFQHVLSKLRPPVRGGCKNPEKARAPRRDITNDRYDGNRQSQTIAVRGRCPDHN